MVHTKLVFDIAIFLLLVALFRSATQFHTFIGKYTGKPIQKMIHSTGVPMLLQWYTVLFAGLTFMMVYTYYKTGVMLHDNWESTNITWRLRWLSKTALFVGVLAFLLIICHFFYDAYQGAMTRKALGEELNWMLSKRQDMSLMVIAVPAIYIIMSLQSSARMRMVIEHQYEQEGAYTKEVDLALYEENFQLAACCQFYVVFIFTRLTYSFIKKHSSPKTLVIVEYAGFQGAHAWVLIGVLQAVVTFLHEYLKAHYAESFGDDTKGNEVFVGILGKLKTIFMPITLLCVYNMLLICKFEPVTTALGNANAKFLGTRLLLLVAQVQKTILESPLFIKNVLGLNPVSNLSEVKLMHSSLITVECLVVVIFNFWFWTAAGDIKKTDRLYADRDTDDEKPDNYKPLDGGKECSKCHQLLQC